MENPHDPKLGAVAPGGCRMRRPRAGLAPRALRVVAGKFGDTRPGNNERLLPTPHGVGKSDTIVLVRIKLCYCIPVIDDIERIRVTYILGHEPPISTQFDPMPFSGASLEPS